MDDYVFNREKETQDSRYWFFRFPENFFDNNAILETETLINNTGYIYIVILLKLYCLTVRDGGTFTIPATAEGGIDYINIGHRIRFNDTNTLKAAIEHLSNVGLIYVTNDPAEPSFSTEPKLMTTIYAPQIENMTESVKPSSDVRRFQRAENQKAARHALPEAEVNEPVIEKRLFGEFRNVAISENEFTQLKSIFDGVDSIIDELSIEKLAFGKEAAPESDYDELVRRTVLKASEQNMKSDEDYGEVPKGTFNNVKISPKEWAKLCREFVEPEKLINHISSQIYKHSYKMPSHYGFAVKCGREDGWETIAQRKEKEAAELAQKMKQAELEAIADAEKDAEVEPFYTQKAKELGVATAQEAADIMRKKSLLDIGAVFKGV